MFPFFFVVFILPALNQVLFLLFTFEVSDLFLNDFLCILTSSKGSTAQPRAELQPKPNALAVRQWGSLDKARPMLSYEILFLCKFSKCQFVSKQKHAVISMANLSKSS